MIASLPSASAEAPRPTFNSFKHTRWTADDGAPMGIREIAQTHDGYLWLATSAGLYRFDGVTFDRVPPPVRTAMEYAAPLAFLLSSSGELWIGYGQSAGVAVYRGGHVQDTHMSNPPVAVTEMAQTADGTIWAATADVSNRLHRFANGRWEQVDERLGLPEGGISALQATRDGTLWVFLSLLDEKRTGRLLYLAAGSDHFRSKDVPLAGFPRSGVDGQGNMWVSDAAGTRVLIGADGQVRTDAATVPPVPGQRFATLAFDKAGGVWGSTGTAGIFYSPGAGMLLRFVAADGLSSDITTFPFVDRENNIWIASALGLDQFRLASVKREPLIPLDPIDGHLISSASDGSVYVASRAAVYRIEPGKSPRLALRTGSDLYSICSARRGGIWVIRISQIIRLRGTDGQALTTPPGGARAMTCADDRHGRLWLGLGNGTVTWRDAEGWRTFDAAAFGGASVEEMVGTPEGNIALRTVAGTAWLVDAETLAMTKLPIGEVRSLSMIASGIGDTFISAANGLWRVRGKNVQLLDRRRFPWLSALRGIVQTPAGDTWLLANDGISRLGTADLNRAFDDPNAPLKRRLFDSRDGWNSMTQQIFFVGPQVAAGGDGRVWFVDRGGAVYVEPRNLRQNHLPPTVLIRALMSGGQIYRMREGVALAAGTRSLEIAYTATSLTVPQRVRFRYRLEGVDDGWVHPGTRRLATYANLGPGRYRFRVIAANEDGVWNATGATLVFEIRPTFTQSWPFRLLCVLSALGLVWLFYVLRLRAVTDRIRARIAERADERERIARELHDTLLQSVQMLTLRFQLAIDYLPENEPARPVLAAAIDQADQLIAEGRDRVRDLRTFDENDVEQILGDIVERQAFDAEFAISIKISGRKRPLDPSALNEIVRIANEAIFNVRRHAHARTVTVDVGYGKDFTFRLVDDGVGIAPEILAGGAREGHFGLPGMRERARNLRGDLEVGVAAGGGTELVLTVPGRIAYNGGRLNLFARFWRSA